MEFTNYKWDKPIFYEAALYKCASCDHSCEMYSNFELVEESAGPCCKCGKESSSTYYCPVFLYPGDSRSTLSIDPAFLSEEKMDCADCRHAIGLPTRFHWTELIATCDQCESGKMFFSAFVAGTRMAEFISIAIEESKLKAPDMTYTSFVNGNEYYLGVNHMYVEDPSRPKGIVFVSDWESRFSAS